MGIDIQAMQDELARNTSLTGSIKAFVATLQGQVTSLQQQLAQAGVDPATVSALADMQATLKANDDTVAAILAGTPADQGNGGSTDAGGGASTVSGGQGSDTTGGGAGTVSGGAGTDTTGGAASGADTTGGAVNGTDPANGGTPTPAQPPAAGPTG